MEPVNSQPPNQPQPGREEPPPAHGMEQQPPQQPEQPYMPPLPSQQPERAYVPPQPEQPYMPPQVPPQQARPPQPEQAYAPPPPPQQPPRQPPRAPSGVGEATSIGLEANAAAGLSYLSMAVAGPIVPIVFYFIEKRSRFLRFHAAQGILLSALGVVGGIVFFLAATAIAAIVGAFAAVSQPPAEAAQTGGVLFGTLIAIATGLYLLLLIFVFVLWVWALVAGFSGTYTKLPIIGGWADRMANGAPVPAT